MEKIEAPESADKKIHIKFPQPNRSGQRVMTLTNVHFAYDTLKVYQGIDLEIEKGQRTVLVGPNGAGKSTLLKILGGVLPIQAGERKEGLNCEVGYSSQNRADMLNPNRTVLQEAMSIPNPLPEVTTRTILGSFLFSGDDRFKKVGVLSGGEKTRLGLVKLLMNPPNLLLMDEPTTHLDMASHRRADRGAEAIPGHAHLHQPRRLFHPRARADRAPHQRGQAHALLRRLRLLPREIGRALGESGASSRASNSPTAVPPKRPPRRKPRAVLPARRRSKSARKPRNARPFPPRARRRRRISSRSRREIAALEARHKEIVAQLESPETYAQGGDVMKLNRELIENTEKQEELNEAWEDATADVAALNPAAEPAVEA